MSQQAKATEPGAGNVIYSQQQDFDGRPVGGWYWTDDETSAPVGPFETLEAAMADHRDMLAACAS